MNPVDELIWGKSTRSQKKAKGSLTLYPRKRLSDPGGPVVENYVKAGESKWRYSVMDAKIAENSGRAEKYCCRQ
jgi:hypothetical protein